MTVCWLYVFVNVEGSYLHPGGKLLTSRREVTYIFEESWLFSCVSQNLIVTLTSSKVLRLGYATEKNKFFLLHTSKLNRTFARELIVKRGIYGKQHRDCTSGYSRKAVCAGKSCRFVAPSQGKCPLALQRCPEGDDGDSAWHIVSGLLWPSEGKTGDTKVSHRR